jgi:hypothetical protein
MVRGEWVGCFEFRPPVAIHLVLFLFTSNGFIGYIPDDEVAFYEAMKRVVEDHKKEQLLKQKAMVLEFQPLLLQLESESTDG